MADDFAEYGDLGDEFGGGGGNGGGDDGFDDFEYADWTRRDVRE